MELLIILLVLSSAPVLFNYLASTIAFIILWIGLCVPIGLLLEKLHASSIFYFLAFLIAAIIVADVQSKFSNKH